MSVVHVDDYITGIPSPSFIPLEKLGKVMVNTARKYGLQLNCSVESVKMDGMGFLQWFKKGQDGLWIVYPKEGMSRLCIIEEENAGSYYLNLYCPPSSAEIKMAQKQQWNDGSTFGGMMAKAGQGKLKQQMRANEQYIDKMANVIFPEALNSPELFEIDIDGAGSDPIPGDYVADNTPPVIPMPSVPPISSGNGTSSLPPVIPNSSAHSASEAPTIPSGGGVVYVDDPEPFPLENPYPGNNTGSEDITGPVYAAPSILNAKTAPPIVIPDPVPPIHTEPVKKKAVNTNPPRNELVFLTREEAMNGCRKEINLDGQIISIDIPAKTTADTILTMPGLGYKDPATGVKGDLNVQFFID